MANPFAALGVTQAELELAQDLAETLADAHNKWLGQQSLVTLIGLGEGPDPALAAARVAVLSRVLFISERETSPASRAFGTAELFDKLLAAARRARSS